jgi:hypothetical protein
VDWVDAVHAGGVSAGALLVLLSGGAGLEERRTDQGFTERQSFDIPDLKEHLSDVKAFKVTMDERYGYRRFLWPVSLLVFFNLVCFSVVWDIIYFHFFSNASAAKGILYTTSFLSKVELPMMAFLGVIVLNYGHMLRRLYVWDVTTQVFWNALQRAWTAVIVAFVIAVSGAFLSPAPAAAQASLVQAHIVFFGMGFVASEVIRWIIDRTRSHFEIKRAKLAELPLSLIQGINYWHEIRLEEEGVENVQKPRHL